MPKSVLPLRAIPALVAIVILLTPLIGGRQPAKAAQRSQTNTLPATTVQITTHTYVLGPEMFAHALSAAEQETLVSISGYRDSHRRAVMQRRHGPQPFPFL